ncbi:hypothetical protein [Pararhizobium sp. O133]|uniref:hypothetical protein n=1 Tax=Pararhizobium sp. O133 TaxID=3449278 RepID=UPI003F685149
MAFFSSEHSPQAGHPSVTSALVSLRSRAVASWKRYRTERELEGLSYDTLKDIGFPSADMLNKDTPTR